MIRLFDDPRRMTVRLIVTLVIAIVERTDGHPGEQPSGVLRRYKRGRVPSCDGVTFCTEIPDYPSDYVNALVSLNESLKYLATIDVPSVIGNRMNDENEEPLCMSVEELVRPKTALSIDDRWLYIVNSDTYMQAVRVELCRSRGDVCRMIDGFAEGYKTTCRQTHVYRQMLAIGPGGAIVTELFKIPATCKCFVKFEGAPWMRLLVDRRKIGARSPVTGSVVGPVPHQ